MSQSVSRTLIARLSDVQRAGFHARLKCRANLARVYPAVPSLSAYRRARRVLERFERLSAEK